MRQRVAVRLWALAGGMVAAAALGQGAPAAAPATPAPKAVPATPARPAVTIHSAEALGLKVYYQNVPWGPQTFATMESAADSFYNQRSWPFARLFSERAFTLEGTAVAAGNYALVFHPASREQPEMSLEVLLVAPGEFLQAGNVMQRAPEGRSVLRRPVSFTRAEKLVPALQLELEPVTGALLLKIAYGDRRLEQRLQF